MKKLLSFLFCVLIIDMSAQTLSVGAGFAYLMPFNNIDYLEGTAGPYLRSGSSPSANALINVVYKPSDRYYFELMLTRYGPRITGIYHYENSTITRQRGGIADFLSLTVGKKISSVCVGNLYLFGGGGN